MPILKFCREKKHDHTESCKLFWLGLFWTNLTHVFLRKGLVLFWWETVISKAHWADRDCSVGLCERPDCSFPSLRCVTEGKMRWPWMCLCLWLCTVEPAGCPALTHCLIKKTLRGPHASAFYTVSHNHAPNKIPTTDRLAMSFIVPTQLAVKNSL